MFVHVNCWVRRLALCVIALGLSGPASLAQDGPPPPLRVDLSIAGGKDSPNARALKSLARSKGQVRVIVTFKLAMQTAKEVKPEAYEAQKRALSVAQDALASRVHTTQRAIDPPTVSRRCRC